VSPAATALPDVDFLPPGLVAGAAVLWIALSLVTAGCAILAAGYFFGD
jgi:hypothetical protein